jgi:hypothetical protein
MEPTATFDAQAESRGAGTVTIRFINGAGFVPPRVEPTPREVARRMRPRRLRSAAKPLRGRKLKNRSIVTFRPECVGCKQTMQQTGAMHDLRWACRRCKKETPQVHSGEYLAGKRPKSPRVYAEDRPCKKCSRPMVVGSAGVRDGRPYQNYFCADCCSRSPRVKNRERRERERQLPSCVRCKRAMQHAGDYKGNQRFKCARCPQSSCSAHTMRRGGHRRASDDGSELLTFIESLLPPNLPADAREEARQAIAVDVLKKKVRRKQLNPQSVRRYVREAFGLNDKFRFLFLDQPCAGAGTSAFGELLEG